MNFTYFSSRFPWETGFPVGIPLVSETKFIQALDSLKRNINEGKSKVSVRVRQVSSNENKLVHEIKQINTFLRKRSSSPWPAGAQARTQSTREQQIQLTSRYPHGHESVSLIYL